MGRRCIPGLLEFHRIIWQALVARQEAFMLQLYSYISLQQLVAVLGFLDFHALVPRTMYVHQCKSAKHNKRILLDQSPQEATTVVSSTHVQRLSGRGRSSALVSRLNLAWKTLFCEHTVFGPTF
jgi:hypothetical protein